MAERDAFNNDEEMVTIKASEYRMLLSSQKELMALEAGGVDNWEYYSDALREGGCFDDEEF